MNDVIIEIIKLIKNIISFIEESPINLTSVIIYIIVLAINAIKDE